MGTLTKAYIRMMTGTLVILSLIFMFMVYASGNYTPFFWIMLGLFLFGTYGFIDAERYSERSDLKSLGTRNWKVFILQSMVMVAAVLPFVFRDAKQYHIVAFVSWLIFSFVVTLLGFDANRYRIMFFFGLKDIVPLITPKHKVAGTILVVAGVVMMVIGAVVFF